MLASSSALRTFYCNTTPESKEYITKEVGFKNTSSLISRLNGLVPCSIHLLKRMIELNEYFKKNVAISSIGEPGIFDYEQAKLYYSALIKLLGSPDYHKVSNKKKARIIDEQNKFYKIINNNN